MLRWNICPRCKGDVRLDRDEYGWYEECLMCGYIHDVESTGLPARHNLEHHLDDKVRVKARRAA